MTFGLVLFICVFFAILGMVVVSEFALRGRSTDSVVAGLDADTSKE
ncbi:hypothetical protein PsAD2_00100 [Pseudovibrio axinellae]|uniref:Uncharacterized protein n=1 Tax=Pseudovibrio axinellae TaxID=989403 RepID=A0A166BAQ4_9HYPH|nr:hypothetical protein [Pseudovibrio axinellae]KZL22075.1 hypothetical protein PsAD2_00100 [Pseudovibrio axinellae]SEQ56248.1 hypothetical protein SAMN05421798_10399 [Pseudovibrio axinellae]